MNALSTGTPAGIPSTSAMIAGPCDSPAVRYVNVAIAAQSYHGRPARASDAHFSLSRTRPTVPFARTTPSRVWERAGVRDGAGYSEHFPFTAVLPLQSPASRPCHLTSPLAPSSASTDTPPDPPNPASSSAAAGSPA